MVGRMNVCCVVACNNHDGMARNQKSHLYSLELCCAVQETRGSFKYNNSSDRPHACEPVDRRQFRRMQKHSKTLSSSLPEVITITGSRDPGNRLLLWIRSVSTHDPAIPRHGVGWYLRGAFAHEAIQRARHAFLPSACPQRDSGYIGRDACRSS